MCTSIEIMDMDEIMCGLVYKQKTITLAALNISLNFNFLNQVEELVARFTSLFGICAAHISFVSRQHGIRELWPSIYCLGMHKTLW